VDVRVGEAGHDAAAAEVDHLRRGERGLVRADAPCDALARDRERTRGGSDASSVRTMPFSRITDI